MLRPTMLRCEEGEGERECVGDPLRGAVQRANEKIKEKVERKKSKENLKIENKSERTHNASVKSLHGEVKSRFFSCWLSTTKTWCGNGGNGSGANKSEPKCVHKMRESFLPLVRGVYDGCAIVWFFCRISNCHFPPFCWLLNIFLSLPNR